MDILARPLVREELDLAERLWIILLNSRNPAVGYNVSAGGDASRLGAKNSIEHNQKIGAANKGRKPKGYVRTDLHRKQLRDRMLGNDKGVKITPETAIAWKAAETPEQKAKRHAAIKASWDRRKGVLSC